MRDPVTRRRRHPADRSEGGYLFRLYVDLGDVAPDDHGAVRKTPATEIIDRANRILHPYTVEVKSIEWHSVYDVGHDSPTGSTTSGRAGRRAQPARVHRRRRLPHAQREGRTGNERLDAGRLQPRLEIGHVLDGRARTALLDAYSAERQPVARDLIEFDRQWSSLMAARPGELEDRSAVQSFYVSTFEFPSGFVTRDQPSILTAAPVHQQRAGGFPIGKRLQVRPGDPGL